MYLRVDGFTLRINCNRVYSIEDIYSFLRSKEAWILKKTTLSHKKIYNGKIYHLGKEYNLVYLKSSLEKCVIDKECITIYSDFSDETNLLEIYYNTCVTKLKEIVLQFQPECLIKLSSYNFINPNIQIKYYKSKWGSCNYRSNVISLNIALIHYSPKAIESVIWHEYCHLVVPNHSKTFYELIYYGMDDYNVRHKELR